MRNEPGNPPTANDDAPIPRYPGGFDLDETPRNEPGNLPQPVNAGVSGLRNEPEPDPFDLLPQPVRAYLEQLLATDDWPGLARLAATGALRPLGLEPADLASPQALGRALQRLTARAA